MFFSLEFCGDLPLSELPPGLLGICQQPLRESRLCVTPGTFFHQALQHGVRERQGDVDRGAQEWERQEEVQAGQQRPLHLKDVPAGRFGDCSAEESPYCWQVNRPRWLTSLAMPRRHD